MRECGTWIVPKKRTFFFIIMRMEILIFLTLQDALIFHYEQNCKQTDQKYLVLKKTRSLVSFISCVLIIGTDLHYAPDLQLIFLPLHVEKLLILCIGNVVVYCQSGIHYVGFLSCCCVALSSLLYLLKSLQAPQWHPH